MEKTSEISMGVKLKKQQEVAKEVLDLVSIIDPEALIAGGAPRDWRDNTLAKDIDIYITYKGSLRTFSDAFSKVIGGTTQPIDSVANNPDCSKNEEPYGDLPGMKWVGEFVFKGQDIQIICMEEGTKQYAILDNFDCSICSICIPSPWDVPWMKGDPDYVYTTQYDYAKYGIIFYREDIKNTKHLEKMKNKYSKTHTFLPKKVFETLCTLHVNDQKVLAEALIERSNR